MKSSFIPSHNVNYEILSHEIYSRTIDKNDGMCYEYGIAIARKFTSLGEQYVTWEFTTVSQNTTLFSRSFFWGHYISNKYIALLDYHERLSNYYRHNIAKYEEEG